MSDDEIQILDGPVVGAAAAAAAVEPGPVSPQAEANLVPATPPLDEPEGASAAARAIMRENSSPRTPPQPAPAFTAVLSAGAPTSMESDEFRKSAAGPAEDDDGVDDGQTCTICFEPWTNAGQHRIVALKCGHLYGKQCIEKWLKGKGEKCPQCNARAKPADLRIIFAKSLKAIDNSEKEAILRDLEKERQERLKLERDAANAILELQQLRADYERLKRDTARKRMRSPDALGSPMRARTDHVLGGAAASAGAGAAGAAAAAGERTLVPAATVRLGQGGARVLSHDAAQGMLVTSAQCSTASVFAPAGFGIYKISTFDLRNPEYVAIHSKQIRDLACCPDGSGLVLTTSMDKTVRLTSTRTNTLVLSYALEVAPWACCWDAANPFLFSVGLANGSVAMFDTRHTDAPIETVASTRPAPVTTIQALPFPVAGYPALLSGSLAGVSAWLQHGGTWHEHRLAALDGPCISLCPGPLPAFLASTRGTTMRHAMAAVEGEVGEGGVTVTCTISGQYSVDGSQKLMSRATLLFDEPDARWLGVAGNQTSNQVLVWDVSHGTTLQRLGPLRSPVLDTRAYRTTLGDSYLALLLEDELAVMRWADS
eukprot:m.108937 g.108937  ORF g.108937 m.108937 type:complete len:598 (+) comp14294_c0_seq1:88-1881(+)